MTNQEAIKDIEENILPVVGGKSLRMAIEALKAESYASERYEDLCKFFRGCDDGGESILHDRVEFKKWLERGRWHVEECDRLAKELDALKVQIAKDINVPNTDCISRQAAIEWCLEGLNNMPSAQPVLDRTKISDLLEKIYSIQSVHLSVEGVLARKYYCKQLWIELFGSEDVPKWID